MCHWLVIRDPVTRTPAEPHDGPIRLSETARPAVLHVMRLSTAQRSAGRSPLSRSATHNPHPRKGYVDRLHRQDTTKTRDERTLILPSRVVEVLQRRIERDPPAGPEAPIFGTGNGNWISPANMRTRLRTAIARATASGTEVDLELRGTSFHTLRRTVGTLIAHEVSLDAAREQLGHRDPSVTYQRYVGKRSVAPDVRPVLDRLFEDIPHRGLGKTLDCREDSDKALNVLLTEQALRAAPVPLQPPSPGVTPDAPSRNIGR